MISYLAQVQLLAAKDLRQLFRRPTAFLSALVFSILLLFIFSLQLQRSGPLSAELAAGFFWIILLFASFFTMNQSFTQEQENDCHWALLLALPEKSVLFLAKAWSNFLLLLLIILFVVPLSIILWDLYFEVRWLLLLSALVLGAAGLSLLGTLFSGITWQAEGEALLLPILALPISIPLLLALMQLTYAALAPGIDGHFWLYLVLFFNTLYLVLPILLFDYILEV